MASSSSSERCSSACPWLLMDRLWFQRSVVLSPHPISSTTTTSSSNIKPADAPTSSFFSSSESNPSLNTSSSTIDCSDEDLAQIFHVTHGSLPIIDITPQDDPDEEEKSAMKMTKQERKKTKPGSCSRPRRLERTLSCRTLAELRQEEVKGFLDLGFIFDKDHVTPRMTSVVPGLQSVEEHENGDNENRHKEEEKEEVAKGNRGYLSEAWMVKRPDSPLLRLRMSRHSTTSADMKKHLKLWAKAVASTSSAAHP